MSYLMINSDVSLSTNEGYIKSIPVGTTLTLSVTYHDNVGEQFYATNVQMRYRFSRYDLLYTLLIFFLYFTFYVIVLIIIIRNHLLRICRYDLVHIKHGSENDTLVVKAAEVGQTILKVRYIYTFV